MSVIDKKTIKEVVKDIQRALIQSDVNIQLVLDLSKRIETRALEEEPPKGITPREHVITIIYEEMVNLLGSEAAGLEINERPYKILFLGLQGSGKTTTIGKLCRYLQKKGFNPAVVCTERIFFQNKFFFIRTNNFIMKFVYAFYCDLMTFYKGKPSFIIIFFI